MFDTIPMIHRQNGLRIPLFIIRTAHRDSPDYRKFCVKNRARLQKNPLIETGEFL